MHRMAYVCLIVWACIPQVYGCESVSEGAGAHGASKTPPICPHAGPGPVGDAVGRLQFLPELRGVFRPPTLAMGSSVVRRAPPDRGGGARARVGHMGGELSEAVLGVPFIQIMKHFFDFF